MEQNLSKHEKVSLAVDIGQEMLKNGGEVYRVDDTLRRILESMGFVNYNVYIVSNGIFVTVDEGTDEAVSSVRNVHSWALDLGKIASLNKLSRDVCEGNIQIREARRSLDNIKSQKGKSLLSIKLATGVGSGAFCFIMGGGIVDILVAFVIGFLLKSFISIAESKGVSKFIIHIVGSILVTILAVVSFNIYDLIRVDKVVIGSIMIMVPGVALTTSIRDFFNGDYLSGGIHMIDALLTAVCIAAGVGVAMKSFMVLGLV